MAWHTLRKEPPPKPCVVVMADAVLAHRLIESSSLDRRLGKLVENIKLDTRLEDSLTLCLDKTSKYPLHARIRPVNNDRQMQIELADARPAIGRSVELGFFWKLRRLCNVRIMIRKI
jgi:hypothetical protein